MGGRGASSGISKTGKKYGTEYYTVLQHNNIKFVKSYDEKGNNKAPMETMSKGRIYGYINSKNELKSLTFFDNKNKRNITVDISGKYHRINGKPVLPHLHIGYEHSENGTYTLNKNLQKLVVKAIDVWYNKQNS